MYKIPANTLFVGKDLVFVPECHSTNTLAHELSLKPSTAEGAVVITDRQTAGRGQRGNTWETQAGKNLTFSIILKPGFLTARDHFFLNVFTSLAILDYLSNKGIADVKIKWPNDILVNGYKICGILIENQIRGLQVSTSVVGVGLNINQSEFSVSTATSLSKILNRQFILEDELEQLLSFVESRYLQLKSGRNEQLKVSYKNNLYLINEPYTFRSNGSTFKGTIIGITDDGLLQIRTNESVKSFDIKEIIYTR